LNQIGGRSSHRVPALDGFDVGADALEDKIDLSLCQYHGFCIIRHFYHPRGQFAQ
jgi:hypothetical protein